MVRANGGNFRVHHVCSQSVVYHCVVQSLPTEVPEELWDLIYEIPFEDSCDILKDATTKHVGLSDRQRLDTLFTNIKIGNREPSQLFRYTKQILGSYGMDDSILRHLWLQILTSPSTEIFAPLKANPSKAELTKDADRMFDASPKGKSAVAVPFTALVVSIWQFKQRMNHLKSQMNVVIKTYTHKTFTMVL